MVRNRVRAAIAFLAAVSLLPAPVFSQDQSKGAPVAPSPAQASATPSDAQAPLLAAPPRKLDLRLDYSAEKQWFPHVAQPYTSMHRDEPSLTNSPRIDQLLQNGKLMLSLQDAISLALENNLAIDVERYTPWLDEINLLRAKSGINGLVPFDPTVTSNLNIEDSVTPLNNPFFAGFFPGTNSTPTVQTPMPYIQHIGNVNLAYNQYFPTGTEFQAAMTNSRISSNFGAFNLYNPYIQSALTLTITQPLLRGFGTLVNTRLIVEAKRSIRVGVSQLEQQIMATTTQVSNDYWELVYARENVKVEEAAVGVSQRLFEENSKRLEIGTLSSLDVLTAQSQLASDKQALVQAQSVQMQDETTLLNDITKNPLDSTLLSAEITPTTMISTPGESDNIRIEDAVKEAWQKRPELKQATLNLENAGTDVKATKNELLPTVNLFGEYIASGLGGVQNSANTTPTGAFLAGLPVVDSSGVPVPGLFQSTAVTTSSPVVFPGGAPQDLGRVFRGDYSSFEAGINITLPIRNRAAQADNAQALLNERQQKTQYRQEQNVIFVSVRNALIAMHEDRASLAAAEESKKLAVQTFEDEQEKYRLGASTSYNVVLRERDVTAAEATDLRDRINLLEDELKFNQAMGRTLEVNNISVADALKH
ncbi:MAG TPA: TolC family protein [Candidatus Sulfotelmatobacter sp.]|jgi:outer membrane protein|nr:TolC family protein [Candidatus Sulfotelmatobacter sp.]